MAAAPHIWAGDSTFAAISGFHGRQTKTCERVTNPYRSPRPEYLATSSAHIMRIIIMIVLYTSLLVVACRHDQAGGPQQSSLRCATPPKPQRWLSKLSRPPSRHGMLAWPITYFVVTCALCLGWMVGAFVHRHCCLEPFLPILLGGKHTPPQGPCHME